MNRLLLIRCLFFTLTISAACHSLQAEETEFKPQQDTLPVPPPAGAIVLFDGGGKTLFRSKDGQAIDWPTADGELVSTKDGKHSNHIVSTLHFRDADLHVEFAVSEKNGGNSGVYLHGHYELQILNSFAKEGELTQQDEGSLYGFAKPLVNASRKAGEWQVYDIRYHAPRRNDAGEITEEGRVTAWLNGQKVQDETRFGEPRSVYHPYRHGVTPYLKTIAERQKKTGVGPVFLQDHGSPARFRNVWVKPLDDLAAEYEPSP